MKIRLKKIEHNTSKKKEEIEVQGLTSVNFCLSLDELSNLKEVKQRMQDKKSYGIKIRGRQKGGSPRGFEEQRNKGKYRREQ